MRNKIVKYLIGMMSFGAGFFLGGKILVGMINDYKKRMERNFSNMMLFNDWLKFIYSGGCVEQYFYTHEYRKIMIYGNGYIGNRLVQALTGTDIEVSAVMDKAASSDKEGLVIGIDSEIPDVDCIVITPVFYYDEIFGALRERTRIPIVSVQKIIETV